MRAQDQNDPPVAVVPVPEIFNLPTLGTVIQRICNENPADFQCRFYMYNNLALKSPIEVDAECQDQVYPGDLLIMAKASAGAGRRFFSIVDYI